MAAEEITALKLPLADCLKWRRESSDGSTKADVIENESSKANINPDLCSLAGGFNCGARLRYAAQP
jgi:hypothetical protein